METYQEIETIDQLLQQTPSLVATLQLQTFLGEPALEQYIFDKLEHPGWLDHLYALKLYDEVEMQSHSTRLTYLARLGSIRPFQVVSILNEYHRPNAHTVLRLLEVCQTLPSPFLKSLRNRVTVWLKNAPQELSYVGLQGFLEAKLDQLDPEDAIEYLRAFLEIVPHFAKYTADDEESSPRSRVSHQYQYFLHQHFDALQKLPGFAALLLDLLEECTSIRALRGNEDIHYMVYFKSLNHPSDIQNFEVDGVLVSNIQLLIHDWKDQPEKVRHLWTLLAQKPPLIFRRLQLFLLTVSETAMPDLIEQDLLDLQNFFGFFLEKEYRKLAHKYFATLPESAQRKLLEGMEQGYFAGRDIRNLISYDKEWTAEALEKQHQEWTLTQLSKLGDFLPEPWRTQKAQLASMVKEIPELDFPDFEVQVGTESTLTLEALRAMTPQEIVELLKNDPPETTSRYELTSERYEGVKQRLATYLNENPELIFTLIDDFKVIRPEYLFTILWFLREFEETGNPPYLEKFVLLFQQLLDLHKTTQLHRNDLGICCDIAEKLLGKDQHFPTSILQVLGDLFMDMLQQPDLVIHDPPKKYDAHAVLNDAINNSLGKAALAFIGWLEHVQGDTNALPALQSQLYAAKAFLLEQLSTHPNSMVLYAAVGFRIPWLMHMDPSWGESLKQVLFDRNHKASEAAWTTYVVWRKVYNETFQQLKPQYQTYATVDLQAGENALWSVKDNMQKDFAEHIAVLLGRGLITFDEPEGLLAGFLNHSSLVGLAHLSSYIGRSIRKEDQMPLVVLERFQNFWDQVIAYPWPEDTMEARRNAFALEFSWWFSNGKFDLNWSLPQLQKVLHWGVLTNGFTWDRLLELTLENPALGAPVLLEYMKTQNIGYFETRNLHQVFNRLVQEDPDLREISNQMVNFVLRLGRIEEFRKYYVK